MKRSITAFIAGLLTWILIASLINRGLRGAIPGYAQVEPAMTFSLGMLWARLAMGAVSSLAAGACAGAIAPRHGFVPWALAIVVLAIFIPGHVHFWHLFPLWYHLTFLLTLVPFIVLGAKGVWSATRTTADSRSEGSPGPLPAP